MVDRRAFDFHFTDGIIALEIGSVVHGVPQTEFDEREEGDLLFRFSGILDGDAHQQTVVPFWYEQFLRDGNAVLAAGDDGVAESVTAAVGVELRLDGLPARIPHAVPVADIEAETFLIQGSGVRGSVMTYSRLISSKWPYRIRNTLISVKVIV